MTDSQKQMEELIYRTQKSVGTPLEEADEKCLWVYHGPQSPNDTPTSIASHVGGEGLGWRPVGRWSRKPLFCVLYAAPGVSLELLALVLNDPKWSLRGDTISVEDGKIIVRTERMAQWVGSKHWRANNLREVTGGKIEFILVSPPPQNKEK